MSRYLVTGFNSETGEIYRGEEQDQEGAEHLAVSWCERQPLGSHADVVAPAPDWPRDHHGHVSYHEGLLVKASCKRVLAGVEWL
jgi:hypothetical protein